MQPAPTPDVSGYRRADATLGDVLSAHPRRMNRGLLYVTVLSVFGLASWGLARVLRIFTSDFNDAAVLLGGGGLAFALVAGCVGVLVRNAIRKERWVFHERGLVLEASGAIHSALYTQIAIRKKAKNANDGELVFPDGHVAPYPDGDNGFLENCSGHTTAFIYRRLAHPALPQERLAAIQLKSRTAGGTGVNGAGGSRRLSWPRYVLLMPLGLVVLVALVKLPKLMHLADGPLVTLDPQSVANDAGRHHYIKVPGKIGDCVAVQTKSVASNAVTDQQSYCRLEGTQVVVDSSELPRSERFALSEKSTFEGVVHNRLWEGPSSDDRAYMASSLDVREAVIIELGSTPASIVFHYFVLLAFIYGCMALLGHLSFRLERNAQAMMAAHAEIYPE